MFLGSVRAVVHQRGPTRLFSTSTLAADASHKVVVVGGGTAGLTVAHQLLRSEKFKQDDIAIVEPSEWHNYQPGWTLVGGGLSTRDAMRRKVSSLINPKIQLYQDAVSTFEPGQNQVTTASGEKLTYGDLVVASGFEINLDNIEGLGKALADPNSKVASIYTYATVDKVFNKIKAFKNGKAIFTQPGSPIKCAGAPQKIMWMALDLWTKAGLFKPHNPDSPVDVDFATGMPTMFSVPKYSEVLNNLREERGVGGLFQHDLVAVEDDTAIFALPSGEKVRMNFDFLHVTPRMKPPKFLADSLLANEAGYCAVDPATLQSVKFDNVWALGDSSSLPTSKTAAAITGEAPVLVENLLSAIEKKPIVGQYDGYTSCPLITEYGKVLLAEFVYNALPKETFSKYGIDQSKPQSVFYHLKKSFFPWVYFNSFVKGTWNGPKGWSFGLRGYASNASPNQKRGFATSAISLRNAPVRRPRDPLNTGRSSRSVLESGATFISRAPPTPVSGRTTLESANALFDSAVPVSEADLGSLPPQLRQRTSGKTLTETEIAQIQQLRAEAPYSNTAGKLAKQFGCSPTFVSIVAPVPKQIRNARAAERKLQSATWGMNKRVASEERRERRALW
ncbi:eukaryotic sulfide quinone oxidoreductase [Malassezia vespertilionis]|uniref:FAD/NAD(P)-binding domain-containing protein n=1 Tax=Malassezia vespertilionis TaxID=2020962 RepID=A0A2N1J948_9BASI|nr:eukaryotic sulfide quinone oxidoreductase [Malassezia vespertilionis]PKI83078.1 hypothetical protein MVES_002759 [Malassezia vespertilionis]WFD07543.1 eukaryotic sulfide quinone oxidoreductase [Malassezia vespertilionis]